MKKGEKVVVCERRRFDFMFWILLIALIALPLAATFLHIRLHNEKYPWLVYITGFDMIVISLLYFSRRTIFYGFMLNTVFFIAGVIARFYALGFGGINDVLISIPDFAVGYALWREYK